MERLIRVEVNSTAGGEHPWFATIALTFNFLERLHQLQKLCVDHGLSEVRLVGAPDKWHVASGMTFALEELVVTKELFWFTAYARRNDAVSAIETVAIDIGPLAGLLYDEVDGVEIIFGNESLIREKLEEGL